MTRKHNEKLEVYPSDGEALRYKEVFGSVNCNVIRLQRGIYIYQYRCLVWLNLESNIL
jgi:hypothetical protein